MKTSKLTPKTLRSKSIGTAALLATAMMTSGAFGAAITVSGTTYTVNGTVSNSGSGDLTLSNGGTIQSGTGTPQITITGNNNDHNLQSGTVNGVILAGGSAELNKTTSGTVTLNSNNTYGGDTNISAGSLVLGAGLTNVLPTGTDVNITGGNLNLNGVSQRIDDLDLRGNGTITDSAGGGVLSGDQATLRTGTVNAVIGGTTTVTKAAAGGTNGLVVLGATNTYTGNTTVTTGTLRLGVEDSIAQSANVIVNGGVLQFSGNNQTFRALSGNGGTVSLGSSTLTVGSSNTDTTYSGNISGTNGNVTKVGTGNLTFDGTNTFTGTLTINDGRVSISGNLNTLHNSSSVVIDGTNAAFNLNNFDETVYAVTLKNGQILGTGVLTSLTDFDLQNGSVNAVLGGTNGVIKSTDGTVVLNNQNTYTGATVVREGTLKAGTNNVIAASSGLVIGDGDSVDARFDLNGWDQTVNAFSLVNGTLNNFTGGASLTSLTDADLQNGTVDAVLAGSSGAIKSGTGTVVLNAQNTYTGATIVNEGTLRAGFDDVISYSELTVQGGTFDTAGTTQNVQDLRLDGGILDDSSEDRTGKIISADDITVRSGTANVTLGGDVRLIKRSSGTVLLTGSNTYTGATSVRNGTLQIGDGVTGSIDAGSDVYVWSSATLAINLSYGGVFANDISNRGTVEGLGNWNSFTGVISGTGRFVQSGSSSVLLGENTYTGRTSVLGGFLFVGDGSTGSISSDSRIFVDSDAAIVFNLVDGSTVSNRIYLDSDIVDDDVKYGIIGFVQSGSTTVTSNIRGEGELYQVGEGKTILTGSSTYTGNTYVYNGELAIEGSVASDVIVSPNYEFGRSVLSGTGYIGGNVYNSGIVSPGNSAGTLTVGGNYSQSVVGAYHVEIESKSNYDRLVVGGTAELAGAVVLSKSGHKPKVGEKYTILSAGAVDGEFDVLLNPYYGGTLRELGLTYRNNTVVLEYIEQSFLDFAKAANLTDNQKAIAKALDRANRHDKLGSLLNDLYDVTLPNIGKTLQLLSPEQLTQIYQIGFANAQTQYNNLDRRLSDVRDGAIGFSANGLALSNSRGSVNYDGMPITNSRDGLTIAGFDGKSVVGKQTVAPIVEQSRWGFFVTGNGEWADVESTSQAQGSEFKTGGFTIGADYRVSDNFVVGIAGGYANTSSDLDNGGDIKVNSGRGSVYASLFGGGFYLNTQVGGAYNSYDTKRGTVGGKANGSTEGGEFNSLIGGGYDYRVGGFSVGPVASLQYTYIGMNGFQETGSSAPQQFGSQNQDSLKSSLGARLSYAWNVGGLVIKPEVRAQWQHEFLDSTASIESGFVGGSGVFTVNGANIGRDSLLLDAGVSVQFNPAVSVFAYYTGEIGRTNYSSNAVNGGFRINF